MKQKHSNEPKGSMREVLYEAPPRPKTGFNPNLRPSELGGKRVLVMITALSSKEPKIKH